MRTLRKLEGDRLCNFTNKLYHVHFIEEVKKCILFLSETHPKHSKYNPTVIPWFMDQISRHIF